MEKRRWVALATAATLVAVSPWSLSGAAAAAAAGSTFTYTSTVTYGRPAASTDASAVLSLLGAGTADRSAGFVSVQQSPSLSWTSGQLGRSPAGAATGSVSTPVTPSQSSTSSQPGGQIGLAAVLALLNGGLTAGVSGQTAMLASQGASSSGVSWSSGVPSSSGALSASTTSTTSTPSAGSSSGATGTAACSASAGEVQYVLCSTNAQRALAGAQPLALDPALTSIAQRRAAALAADGTLTHDIPGLGYAVDMETAAGVTGTLLGAEDLATGQSVDQAFWMLMTSDWHRANLLYQSYNTVGIAIAPMATGTVVLDMLFIQR